MKLNNIVGKKIGRLTVVRRADNSRHGSTMWICRCVCGNEIKVFAANLRRKNTRSCGCLKKEIVKTVNVTHGMTETREYSSWLSMKGRCKKSYFESCFYFDRGIKVCDRWMESFENFYKDMGDRPPKTSIDRIDNNKGYSPDNCRWASCKEQSSNRRSNITITHNGVSGSPAYWSKIIKISCPSILARKYRGWSDDMIVETPLFSSPIIDRPI